MISGGGFGVRVQGFPDRKRTIFGGSSRPVNGAFGEFEKEGMGGESEESKAHTKEERISTRIQVEDSSYLSEPASNKTKQYLAAQVRSGRFEASELSRRSGSGGPTDRDSGSSVSTCSSWCSLGGSFGVVHGWIQNKRGTARLVAHPICTTAGS